MPAFYLFFNGCSPAGTPLFFNELNFTFIMATFLDYYKTILDKVSFDPVLLNKEYQKAKRNLQTNEIGDLNCWLKTKGFHAAINENGGLASTANGLRQRVLS
jgi:hypothetical protein